MHVDSQNHDYVDNPNTNIMTEFIECLFAEVMSQTRKHKRKIIGWHSIQAPKYKH